MARPQGRPLTLPLDPLSSALVHPRIGRCRHSGILTRNVRPHHSVDHRRSGGRRYTGS